MSTGRCLLVVLVSFSCTFFLRALPFLAFSGERKMPAWMERLSHALPPAIMAVLVVYCLKNVGWVTGTHGIPELLCIAITALLHIWKHNNLLSIGVGTVLYMVLVQNVFV